MLRQDEVLLQTIVKHCSDPQFNVSALAEKTGKSASFLCEKSYSCYGMSIKQVIEMVRLERAVKLLMSNDNKIELVRKAAGYEYSKTFRTAFKKRLNLTPQQCKNKLLRADNKQAEIKQLVIQLWKYFGENNL